MKVEIRGGGRLARKVLIGVVIDDRVCGAVSAKWTPDGLFGSRPENMVARWAMNYYRKYHKAPGRRIEDAFDRWAESRPNDESKPLVEAFVASLSDEYRRSKSGSSEAVIDLANEVFTIVQMDRVRELLEAAVANRDVKAGVEAMAALRPVDVAGTDYFCPFKGGPNVRDAFDDVSERLIEWPQEALKTFFTHMLAREEFIVFMAGEKRAKSFCLQEVAIQAWMQGLKVAFFEVGDQSKFQITRRIGARASDRPFRDSTLVRYPIAIEPGTPDPTVVFEPKKFSRFITGIEADSAMKVFGKRYGTGNFRLSIHPNSSLSVLGMESILDRWHGNGFVPDVVLCDYSDILAPINGKSDTRDQINETWKGLRRLNQSLHCLFVTATQANAASYDKRVLTRQNFSEDKRKYAHATGFIGINQTPTEKKDQLMRLNWILGRDLDFSEETCVYCAQNLACANPMVLSSW